MSDIPLRPDSALILEGGGLRGVYTTGVLRLFMERGLWMPNVLGVSMGACNAANYLSRQIERNDIVNVEFVRDPRYLSYSRLLRGGDLFGMDFIFDTIPNRLVPFDYRAFAANPASFRVVTTDCVTGEALYHEKSGWDHAETMALLRASASLPLLARPVPWKDARGDTRLLMDGGVADPVPLAQSRSLGHQRQVLVLTQPKGYRKTASPALALLRLRHPKLPGLHKALRARARRYNRLMDEIDRLENQGAIFVIRPGATLRAGRVERDKTALRNTIRQGYRDAERNWHDLMVFLR